MQLIDRPYPYLRQRLLEQGYREQAPSAEARRLDAQVCREAPCTGCGQVGLSYRPFWSQAERSYRAFAVCAACGRVEEF